ncbi:MAG: glycosyltransferase family 2 protein, partial [Actinobacteria bacterium]
DTALRSLFAQDYEPFESIVVDDGSTDATPEIARAHPVRYIRQENAGRAAACNTAIAAANGELMAWLDADDVLPPAKLSSQAARLIERPDIGCVLGKQTVLLEDFDAPDWMREEAQRTVSEEVPFVSLMIRTPLLVAVGGFDPDFRYAEDRDLLVRLREAGVVGSSRTVRHRIRCCVR